MVLVGSNAESVNLSKVALVTGATGFIGRHLVESLLEKNYVVRIYTTRPESEIRANFGDKVSCFFGQYFDQEKLIAACQGVDVVFHLAGPAHSIAGRTKESNSGHLTAVTNTYRASVFSKVNTFVYFSSILAAAPSISSYACDKRASEEFLMSFSSGEVKTRVVILRPATVYGPGMKGNLITYIRLIKWRLIPALPDLSARFPMVSVKDLCRVSIDAARSCQDHADTHLFNVSDGQDYTPVRIENAILKQLGRGKPFFKMSRHLLFLGACLAQLASSSGAWKNRAGLGLYRNLLSNRTITSETDNLNYQFIPIATFESELPDIISELQRRKL